MKYNIRSKDIKITDAIRSYIETKIGKLDKYFDNPDSLTANVLVKIKGYEQIVEVTIITKRLTLRGEVSDKDLYAAIDLVLEKIERQIRKNKSRIKKQNKNNSLGFMLEDEVINEENEIVVKRKTIDTKPMSEDEAILQMNLLDHEFFVFKDVKSEQTCILYKRKDGNYGIIETR